MDSVFNAAVEEICCEGPNGLYLIDLWPKLTSSSLASLKIPFTPKLKQIVLENLVLIPTLKFEADDGSILFDSGDDQRNCSVEECENKNVKIVASVAMRNCFLGIAEMEALEPGLSNVQRTILDRLAFARTNGIAQHDLSKELRVPAKNFFFPLKTLETMGLIVRVPAIIRKKLPSERREPNVDAPVHTNMLYLFRYGKHLSSQQRLEVFKEELGDTQTETGGDFAEDVEKDTVHVKDFLPALQAICKKLEDAPGKVLVVSEIKMDLGYRGTAGHRAWRAICNRLKDAHVVEECWTEVNKKKVSCLRLLKQFSPSHFEQKLHGRGHDEVNVEQPVTLVKRGQITNQLVELPIMRQIYELIDAAGSKGLTNAEVCEGLGLCSKEYHKRYFNQRIFRFALHPDLETRRKNQVYRLYTAGNFNRRHCGDTPEEKKSAMKKSPELNSTDMNICWSVPQVSVDTSAFTGNVRGTKESEHSALVTVEDSTDMHANGVSKSILLCKLNQDNSDDEQHEGVPDNLVTSIDQLEKSPCTVAMPSRVRSCMKYSCLTTNGTSSQREQRILEMLQEEKLLIKADLHKRLESLEKEKNTVMDRRTLARLLNKLQQEGQCKCISVGIPSVTNCSRTRTTAVILHPSVEMSPELSGLIHDKIRAFEIRSRQHQLCPPKSNGRSAAILDNVQRIPNSVRLGQSERAEVMRTNGFVLAKMVRVKLLHTFLWGWISSSPGWDEDLLSSNHVCDMKNPHSSCKLFNLDLVIMAMPLELFLQVIGSAKKIEGMVEKCGRGLLLSDLPVQEYKCLMDTGATGRLSGLIDILQRLKLIRLVNKSPTEDGASRPHSTLIHALELKPYIEEPASIAFSSRPLFPDLRPQARHDFVLSSRKAVDEYWNTLEYCYSATRSRAALLAFPGSAVDEVFRPRSWAAARVMTAGQRAEVIKRVASDDPNKKLSFNECRKIARDLNLTLEQVLRLYYDSRLLHRDRSRRISDGRERIQPVARPKRKRSSRVSSKQLSAADGAEVPESLLVSDKQFDDTQQLFSNSDGYSSQLQRHYTTDDNRHNQDEPETHEEEEAQASIHKGLSSLTPPRRKKCSWTEEADRKLVIAYARCRAALGAKFNRVDWASLSDLPAYPGACKRRMAILRSDISFRRAISRLCKKLADRYAKYLEICPDKMLNQVESKKIFQNSATEGNNICFPDPEFGNWDDFDHKDIKATLENVLRLKKMAKLEVLRKSMNQENKDFDNCGETKALGKRSRCRRLHPKYVKLLNKGASVSNRMHESVAIANATELCKLIFLSSSAAPEMPMVLSETLRRYSEHDLFSAFSYMKEKRIMGGGNGKPFALSQQFLQSISPNTFPIDTGKRALMFASWLHEKEKDLIEGGLVVPLDVQCGDIFTLCAQLSLGELAITACLPDEGFGEAEDNSKRKLDCGEPDGEIYKKLKTSFVDGETTSRRVKGFPGIKLSLHRAKTSRLFAIESSEDSNLVSGGNDPTTLPDTTAECSPVCSDVADHIKEILDSEGSTHLTVSMDESPWKAMTTYLIASYSYKVDQSSLLSDLFKTIYSAIQKSGDQGLNINEIQEHSSIEDEKVLENVVEVLESFGWVLKVNSYNSIHIVDSLYRPKYFLGSVQHAVSPPENQERKYMSENMAVDLDSPINSGTASERETEMTSDNMHRVTILNLSEDVADCPEGFGEDKMTDSKYSKVSSAEMNWGVQNLMPSFSDTVTCQALFPWINGDGTVNEPVYNRLIRRILGIVMQNPGILEDGIINQMHCVNPQSCRKLVEIMVLDNHIIPRKMHQMDSSTQPPSILGGLFGGCSGKRRWISRVHYFANPTSASSL